MNFGTFYFDSFDTSSYLLVLNFWPSREWYDYKIWHCVVGGLRLKRTCPRSVCCSSPYEGTGAGAGLSGLKLGVRRTPPVATLAKSDFNSVWEMSDHLQKEQVGFEIQNRFCVMQLMQQYTTIIIWQSIPTSPDVLGQKKWTFRTKLFPPF